MQLPQGPHRETVHL